MRRGAWLWLGLVMIGGSLGACVPAGQSTAGQIVAQMQEAEAQVKDYHAVVETVLVAPGEEARLLVQEIWRKEPDLLRAELKEGPEEMVGQVTVFNGEQAWFYDPHLNQVQIFPVSGPFELPEPDLTTAMWAAAEELLSETTASSLGEEVVGGRKAHKVQLVPQPGTDLYAAVAGEPLTVWIDQEHSRRLRMEVPLPSGWHYTMHYRSVEYNVGLSDALFEFTPPAGVKAVREEAIAEAPAVQGSAVVQAQEAVGFPLLLPVYLPAGMGCVEARVVDGGGSVTLVYADNEVSFSITEAQATDVQLADIGEETSLGETTARLRRQGGRFLSLSWQEQGLVILLTGTISEEEALEVARSMK